MAVQSERKGQYAQPIHIYTDAVVDITSIDPAAPDVIIPWTKMAPGGKINIAVRESNTKEVRIQPWIAIREPTGVIDGDEIEYSPTTSYWTIPADGRDHIAIDENFDGLWIQVTGYLGVAGTAKVHTDVLIS